MAFGGLVQRRQLEITETAGSRSRTLSGLGIAAGHGLGGQAVAQARPVKVDDYIASSGITHHFDRTVQAEVMRAVAAIPVCVDGEARAVVYTATRGEGTLGDAALRPVAAVADAVAKEIAIRDEVDRRVRMVLMADSVLQDSRDPHPKSSAAATALPLAGSLDQGTLEAVRLAHAELVAMATVTHDPADAERLRGIADMLRQRRPTSRSGTAPTLTKRELEVLSQAALGCSYAEIAARLSLKPMTVKGYMRDILSRLQVRNRGEAVAEARRHGLIP